MRFGSYQSEILTQGMNGAPTTLPLTFAALEAAAATAMSPRVWSYVVGGAGDESTQRANVTAFQRWGLIPRVLTGAADPDISIDLFGMTLPSPVFMAPIGALGVCTPDGHGDLAAAQASDTTGVPLIVSTFTNDPLETVAAHLGATPGLFQLYVPNDRALATSLIHRAESAGYRAIVITLDQPVTGWRPADLATAYSPPLHGQCLANYTSDPVFCAGLDAPPADDMDAAVRHFLRVFPNPLSWADLAWLRSQTTLPLIVKGIAHPDDTRRAKHTGVDAIYCSNHGGRQANGGLPALDCLPAVVDAADGLPVLFDSGVRSGADIVKALALGATAVGIGRPYVYGLATGGAAGVSHVLRSILAESALTMTVDGYPSRADLTPQSVRPTA